MNNGTITPRSPNGTLILDEYDRGRAVEYARKWALSRNPIFENFSGVGGDCTNFVSQAVYAGSCQMDLTPTFGWYFKSIDDRAPAWTGVDAFFDFMTGSGDFPPAVERPGPFGYAADAEFVEVGDVVQLINSDGIAYHTLIITDLSEDGEILVSAHTNDALDRPLSSYQSAVERRFIRILGVARPEGEARFDCFTRLMEG